MAVDGVRLEAAARNSAGEKGEQKDELDSTGPLAEKQKSAISGKRHRPKPILWEKNS